MSIAHTNVDELAVEPDPVEDMASLFCPVLFSSFEKHVDNIDVARQKRVEVLSFKSVLEDDGGDEVRADASQDELDGLGIWLPTDERQGDVNFRTLLKLLTRVDQRGFERHAHTLHAHTHGYQFTCPFLIGLHSSWTFTQHS